MFPLCDFPHTEPRRATVLFDGAFHCSLCAEVLIGAAPARIFAQLEFAEASDRLLEAMKENAL